ncbi:MAG: CDP-diacylglycerol--serine O-phosphatidyltransferase [Bacteroidia bacterium]|nr:CDP-diacylglycerol--serine O-phosphatidyltransferase [Bacteroidales bacterium]NCD41889.1 CDP-diacylglycerol--serine O-phosphatidyltransferase [Bacteroidia bacterium]
MRKHIPNFITLLNLVSGLTGLFFLASGRLHQACVMVMIASFFDFFDGTVARILGVSSNIGIELDSLGDLVSFGVLPGFVVFYMINGNSFSSVESWMPFVGFLIPVFAALRLARFNLDSTQQSEFKGVPVPLMAWFFAALPLIYAEYGFPWLYSSWVLIIFTLVFCFLMVSKVPVLSLKFSDFSFRNNRARYLLTLVAVVTAFALKTLAIPVVILLTLLFSVVEKYFLKTPDNVT